ncbi:hypothetical protein HYALB_00000379 [Hymenoscyphus albidus]|uniref:Enoyl reductase (ER) domain-containing protein n=1 Tax=Hymenoscyphus albidus TaxID=595503 RepID=A0A9N9LLM9_9HELO|nr:hypothetical protein HYALB_00000379 [Hymenoscyphus albidus]
MAAGAQTAIVQTEGTTIHERLTISRSIPIPTSKDLPSRHHVLVRVLTVALNPTDHKMVMHFPVVGSVAGCDFCGVIEAIGTVAPPNANFPTSTGPGPNTELSEFMSVGDRICGGLFPYTLAPDNTHNGSFSEYVVVDSRLCLKIPAGWSDLEGAALGGIGWATVGLAFCDADALALQGRPSAPVEPTANGKKVPILVYGGATATGTMAVQLLNLSGYSPIAVTSTTSAPLASSYGAAYTAAYTSATCTETIKSLAQGVPIRQVLDCITDIESVAICFGAMPRTGGRYACLEALPDAWKTRRSIKTKEVMAYEGLGVRVDLGDSIYTREANKTLFEVTTSWTIEVQRVLDAGKLRPHPIREIPGKWDGIRDGLAMLLKGEIRGEKLVVRITTL